MLIPKLAFRNIIGAGLRTWLNVLILSIAFVAIIWTQGMLQGMNNQAMTAQIDTEYGGGQFWHQAYDPYNPLTLDEAHAPLSDTLAELVVQGQATPILIASGAIYPQGRIQTAQLKGIDPHQQIVNIPSEVLATQSQDVIPALIGTRMAKQTDLEVGDFVTVRWRDIHGTFDATDVQIVQIMSTTVQSVDSGQLWLPLEKLRTMLQAPDEATLVVLAKDIAAAPTVDEPWIYRDLEYLLKDIIQLIQNKSVGAWIMYILLLGMGLLAIFDTQVLAIFRRRKEMGTLMALGMSRGQVIGLFTLEGGLHGLLALVAGAVYGIPLLMYSARAGIGLPKEVMDSTGFAISDRLYPTYGLGLVLGTTAVVLITVTIVSFLPTRRIVKLKPTDALRGKLS
ncbi:FtsX-like permease family protein [candidate division KSB3 bacterium]|uniref:FtsX-like permease family protein n=1 Tax=candidate division KSB3 bacterium TaxID=2044937 RepID=A0A9D5Q4C1_9BACT|nr:FtsX-like permease family protein [candidate division KSB3 bacterium]MBD3323037.1 FtsX-like permease family protein [candidate division KSB3 bacterium]